MFVGSVFLMENHFLNCIYHGVSKWCILLLGKVVSWENVHESYMRVTMLADHT